MGTVNVTLGDGKKLNLVLGQQLENAVTAVVFDFSAWKTEFGSGTLGLSVQRHGDDQPYAVVPTVSGTNATWNISELDTAYKGVGEVQVTYTVGSVVKKSTVYKFTVYRSLGENGEYPSPGQTWQEEIEDELADVKQDFTNYISNDYTVHLGGLDVSTGEIVTGLTNRAYTDLMWLEPCQITVYGLKAYIVKYNSDGSFASADGWKYGTFLISSAGFYRLLLGKTDNTDITDLNSQIKAKILILKDNNIKSFYVAVGASNYSSVLPNANTAEINKVYRMIFANGSTSIPSNLPFSKYKDRYGVCTLMTFANDEEGDLSGAVQIFISQHSTFVRQYRGGQWQTWNAQKKPYIVVDKSGYGDYTSFCEAIIDAYNIPQCTVYVNPGTYDLFAEMKALFGDTYWDNATTSTAYIGGLPFGNGMHIIGTPDTVIQFDGRQTDNSVVWDQFAPLWGNIKTGDITKVNIVENLFFRTWKNRYSIHLDEGAIANDYTYIVRDCRFYIDNTENPAVRGSIALGMGGSISTNFVIENNYIYPVRGSVARDATAIYWHNTNASNPYNRCRISDNYVDNGGTIRIDQYGTSTNKCQVLINGNSVGADMIINVNTDNVACHIWNNEVRT